MSFLNPKQLIASFRYAFQGFWYAVRAEQNFRIQLFASVIIFGLMFYFEIGLLRAAILTLVIMMVLILELINTIFERLSDVLRPRIHEYVEIVKNLMATVVLIASVGSVIIGILIFWPYFWR